MTIISLALLAAVGLGFYFYSTAGSNSKNPSNRKTSSNSVSPGFASASQGAVPPNVLGPSTAPITLEEFADFQCPTCAATHPKIKEVKNAFGDRIRVIFRNFPLNIPAHDKAYDAAVASEAAGAQGKFWDMQNLLFTNQQTWSTSADYKKIFDDYAQRIGLDMAKFKNDMVNLTTKNRVDADMKRGREVGITSTPSIFINGKPVASSDFDVAKLKEIIEAELQKLSSNIPTPPANSANVK